MNNQDMTISVEGNRPLLLDSAFSALRIIEGSLDIFFTNLDKEGRPGHRRFIGSRISGEVLFTGKQEDTAACYTLLATGSPGTLVMPVKNVSPPEAESWVKFLHEKVLCHVTIGKSVILNEETGLITLQQEQVFLAKPAVLWFKHRTGTSRFKNSSLSATQPQSRGGLMPISEKGWYQTQADSELEIYTTDELTAQGLLFRSLDCFNTWMLELLACEEELSRVKDTAQFQKRLELDRRVLSESVTALTAVMPRHAHKAQEEYSHELEFYCACRIVAQASHIQIKLPKTGRDKLASIAEFSAFRTRQVVLQNNWWKGDNGALLAFTEKEGHPVALIPGPAASYIYHDIHAGKQGKVTAKIAEQWKPFAYIFYKPLPLKAIGLKALFTFAAQQIHLTDLLILIFSGIATGFLGLVIPFATGYIIDTIIPQAQTSQLLILGLLIILSTISLFSFQLLRSFYGLRLKSRLNHVLEAAIWDRLLRLSVSFFKNYSTGDLAERADGLNLVRQLFTDVAVNSFMSLLFAMINLFLLFYYSASLAGTALLLVLLAVVLVLILGSLSLRYESKIRELEGKISGILLQIILGLSKFRISGSEEQAFYMWAKQFGEKRRLQFKARQFTNGYSSFSVFFPIICSLIIYRSFAAELTSGLSAGAFLAFVTAFNLLLSVVLNFTQTLLHTAAAVPLYRRAKPLLSAVPEQKEVMTAPGELSGEIEIKHIHFKYDPTGPHILRDLSLAIKSGEYIALVGPSGSGKSTLLRLLLGFEKPLSGTIYYDKNDMALLDINAVRRQIGVVLQSCQIMSGDIFSNIIGSSVNLTLSDAWEAAAMAGLDKDIREMPMGMYTVINEGGTMLSGGQRQRLLIARALVTHPRIVIFDEATSALDNLTQKIVSASLDAMSTTRIVIAHRLSTVVNADRIIVMESGTVVQMGTYNELLKNEGPFRELMKRQLV